MDKKTVPAGVLILVAIAGLILWGRAAARPAVANHADVPRGALASALSAPETFHDFGTISMKNGIVSHDFTVVNNTSVPVYLTTVYTSCMCTTAFLETPSGEKGPFGMQGMGYVPPANDTIAAGETRVVKVIYDPNAHGPAGIGSIDRFAYLVDDKGGALTLEIKALVTP